MNRPALFNRLGKALHRRSLLGDLGYWSLAFLLANVANSAAINEGFAGDDWASEFFEVALPIITKASTVRVFKLSEQLYASGQDLTLEKMSPLPPAVELSEPQKNTLISMLSNRASYNFAGRKAMRFYADYGLIFEGSGIPNVLLISTSFEGARLVLENPFASRYAIVNLELVFPELISLLEPVLHKGE